MKTARLQEMRFCNTFTILTDLDHLTNYSSMKLSSFLQTERNEVTIAGTFTRVDYPRIK